MKKTIRLLKFLHKAEGNRFGNSGGGSSEFLPQILALIIGSGAFGYLGIKYGVLQALLGEPSGMLQGLILGGAVIGGFVFTLPQLINYMFFADDFDVFLAMPFSMPQILSAKVLSSADWLITIAFITTIPFGITSGISCGMGATYFLAAVLAFIFMPVFVLAFMVIVVLLLMFLIKGMRKNDTFKVIGGLAVFALMILYIFVIRGDDLGASLKVVSDTVQKVSFILPINIFLGMLMKGNVVIGILGTLGLTLVAVLLALLLSKTIYLPTLLSMNESSGKRFDLTDDMMQKACRKTPLLKSYLRKEYRMVRREPAYLLKGFLMTLFLPGIYLCFFMFAGSTAELFSLSHITDLPMAICWCTMTTTMITVIAAATNAVAASSMSREGAEIQFFKQTPVPLKIVLQAKHLLAFLICAAGSTTYVLVGGLVLVVMGVLPAVCILYALILNVILLFFIVSTVVLTDVCKPFLDWSDQAAMIKKTSGRIIQVVIIFVGMIAGMAIYGVSLFFPKLWYLLCGGWLLLFLVLGVIITRLVYKVGLKKMAKY